MSTLEIDRESLLVRVGADVTLAALMDTLAREGLILDAPSSTETVGDWIAAGADGAPSPYADPANHLVAGFVARSARTGELLRVKPGPRRSVGPDLFALVFGLRGRLFALVEIHLVVRSNAASVVSEPHAVPADLPVSAAEEALFAAIADRLS